MRKPQGSSMRIAVSSFGFRSQFTRWLRASWNLAVFNGAFRQSFQHTAVARLLFGCLFAIAQALGGLSCGTCDLRPFIRSPSTSFSGAIDNTFVMGCTGKDSNAVGFND